MKKPIIGAKKKAAAAAEAKFGSLPKSKGLAMQPSPSNRMAVESIKSKGLVAKSPMSKVEKSMTPPSTHSMSDQEWYTRRASEQMKAKEKKLPAIEVERRKQQIMKEYVKNKAAGAKKATKK